MSDFGASEGGQAAVRPSRDRQAQDLAAVSEVLRGNTEAFRSIVERYGPLLYRLSFSFLGNREDAEECVQDILVRAFRYLRRFRLEKRFLPWLYGIAMNHLRTTYAARRRRQSRCASWEPVVGAAEIDDPQKDLESAQSRERIRAAVAALPRTVREPVILHYFEELKIAAIAEILQISEVNVKSRLLRGRRRLRRILEQGATPAGPQ
ncbi:MAG: sigma-70 family RNA polymerase sigma factor [Spirochaetales bacterium]|nr:sigma-70 family RNA polymerase sigma factor [Spirochaetales bacterium]